MKSIYLNSSSDSNDEHVFNHLDIFHISSNSNRGQKRNHNPKKFHEMLRNLKDLKECTIKIEMDIYLQLNIAICNIQCTRKCNE